MSIETQCKINKINKQIAKLEAAVDVAEVLNNWKLVNELEDQIMELAIDRDTLIEDSE